MCRRDLTPEGPALRCAGGHSYDIARSGYVNLLSGRNRLPSRGGDARAQLDRRSAFLAAGHFDFIAEAILAHLAGRTGLASLLEAGCGTGYHLARIAAGLGECRGLGLDLSKQAVHSAARRYTMLAFAVADLWREWPVHSGRVDVVIGLFAPKNFAETARVLRPGGRLVVAYPGPEHLIELRRDFGLMEIAPDKAETYREGAAAFAEIETQRLDTRLELTGEDAANAILMGPNAARLAERDLPLAGRSVTASVELMFAARR